MKMKIIDDKNRVSGWFIAFCATSLFGLANFVAPFFTDRAVEVIERIGYQMNISYLTVVGVWFTKATIKSFNKSGDVEFYSRKNPKSIE